MDKIKIYLPFKVAEVIDKDAEAFEFFKKDGITPNRNALLTNLILNYGEAFERERKRLEGLIAAKLKRDDRALAGELCQLVAEAAYARGESSGKFEATISLKPTRQSEGAIEYIENYLLAGRSLSEYFRAMFSSYASLPQDRREAIIFKPQYEAIEGAIKEQRRVFITTSGGRGKGFELAPYAIASSKEELHLYVIVMCGATTTVRLSRIASVKVLESEAQFTEKQLETARKMIKYGPQFFYGSNDGEACVRLTARGLEKWKKIYVHRPLPDRVEGNLMWFNCSHIQLEQYFLRFGADAEILYPESVRKELHNFHSAAAKLYE